ncbi:MAG: DUF3536 domain-containing protein [Desulfomonile tiedjei]|nr:DUF3536 domain-containing protein [Desulfomonile tiedjei]
MAGSTLSASGLTHIDPANIIKTGFRKTCLKPETTCVDMKTTRPHSTADFKRSICIHGHFYQPPRENPWLEELEIEESAHPYHDWNERIAAECYTTNAQARLLDRRGRLRRIINNYEYISFDFGPTLLSWLQRHCPETYQAILDADKVSQKTRSGHGNALAHAYSHMIMPLASRRDKITQVVWGIEDFAKRFNRDPEGIWLPETAVDGETLAVLADHGIRFTILAPQQARRFRASHRDPWTELNPGSIDPSRPYVCPLPRGRSIVLFFYDAPISHSIAFERLLDNGAALRDRLLDGFAHERSWPQLVHIATDGESYGHHHRFGEMALAYALEQLWEDATIRLTNYGEYLENSPPVAEADFVENSSWSCAHGIGRWNDDCGCSLSQRPDWNQQWRKPLRQAMDLLRDRVDKIFVKQGRSLLKDPWAARDAYIGLVLDHRTTMHEFLAVHGKQGLLKGEHEAVLQLLEMQRHRMLMYTSCGWFFDDISGIETAQNLSYAARVLQLAYPFDSELSAAFLKVLSRARSNMRPHLTGDELFRQKIAPQVVDLPRVAAHEVISSAFEDVPARGRIYCYDVKIWDTVREESGERTLLMGRIWVRSQVTGEARKLAFVVVHLGGVDLRCSLAAFTTEAKFKSAVRDILATFQSQSSTELVRRLDHYFPGKYFSLGDLFVDQRRKIVRLLTTRMFEEQARLLESFYKRNRDVAKMVIEHDAILPDTFLAAARFVLTRNFLMELEKLSRGEFPDRLANVLDEERIWKIEPDLSSVQRLMGARILELLRWLAHHMEDEAVPRQIVDLLDVASNLDMPLDLADAQILFFRIVRSGEGRGPDKLSPLLVELANRLAVRVDDQK